MTSSIDNIDLTKLAPEMADAIQEDKAVMAALNIQPDGPAKEAGMKATSEALVERFRMGGQGSGSTTPTTSFIKLFASKERRELYPGAKYVDHFTAKDEAFKKAYRTTKYKEDLLEEFYSRAQAGQVAAALVVVVGMTLAVGEKYEKEDMEECLCRLLNIWMREVPAVQAATYNFFKAAEMPESSLLPVAEGLRHLEFPHFPFHPFIKGKNAELINTAQSLYGGGYEDDSVSKLSKLYSHPKTTIWG